MSQYDRAKHVSTAWKFKQGNHEVKEILKTSIKSAAIRTKDILNRSLDPTVEDMRLDFEDILSNSRIRESSMLEPHMVEASCELAFGHVMNSNYELSGLVEVLDDTHYMGRPERLFDIISPFERNNAFQTLLHEDDYGKPLGGITKRTLPTTLIPIHSSLLIRDGKTSNSSHFKAQFVTRSTSQDVIRNEAIVDDMASKVEVPHFFLECLDIIGEGKATLSLSGSNDHTQLKGLTFLDWRSSNDSAVDRVSERAVRMSRLNTTFLPLSTESTSKYKVHSGVMLITGRVHEHFELEDDPMTGGKMFKTLENNKRTGVTIHNPAPQKRRRPTDAIAVTSYRGSSLSNIIHATDIHDLHVSQRGSGVTEGLNMMSGLRPFYTSNNSPTGLVPTFSMVDDNPAVTSPLPSKSNRLRYSSMNSRRFQERLNDPNTIDEVLYMGGVLVGYISALTSLPVNEVLKTFSRRPIIHESYKFFHRPGHSTTDAPFNGSDMLCTNLIDLCRMGYSALSTAGHFDALNIVQAPRSLLYTLLPPDFFEPGTTITPINGAVLTPFLYDKIVRDKLSALGFGSFHHPMKGRKTPIVGVTTTDWMVTDMNLAHVARVLTAFMDGGNYIRPLVLVNGDSRQRSLLIISNTEKGIYYSNNLSKSSWQGDKATSLSQMERIHDLSYPANFHKFIRVRNDADLILFASSSNHALETLMTLAIK